MTASRRQSKTGSPQRDCTRLSVTPPTPSTVVRRRPTAASVGSATSSRTRTDGRRAQMWASRTAAVSDVTARSWGADGRRPGSLVPFEEHLVVADVTGTELLRVRGRPRCRDGLRGTGLVARPRQRRAHRLGRRPNHRATAVDGDRSATPRRTRSRRATTSTTPNWSSRSSPNPTGSASPTTVQGAGRLRPRDGHRPGGRGRLTRR